MGATPRNGCSAVFEKGQGEVPVQARGRAAAIVEEEKADPSAWRRPAETRHGDGRGNGCSAVFEQGQGKVPVQA